MPISPKFYVYGAALMTLVLAWGGSLWWAFDKGKDDVQGQWQASITQQALADSKLVHASDIVTTRVVTQTIDRVHLKLTAGATITKEVPVYVSAQTDVTHPVPLGFACVLNAAATGKAVDAICPTGSYDSAIDAPLSVVATVITANQTSCNADRERLRGLQQWVSDQEKLADTKKPSQ